MFSAVSSCRFCRLLHALDFKSPFPVWPSFCGKSSPAKIPSQPLVESAVVVFVVLFHVPEIMVVIYR